MNAWTFMLQFSHMGVILVILASGLGFPVPEEIPLLAGGILARQGAMTLVGAMVVCYVTVLVADVLVYLVGWRFGEDVVRHRWFKWFVKPERLVRVEASFDRSGSRLVFIARFISGFRFVAFLAAGVARFSFWRFVAADALAALISVPLCVGLGYVFAQNIQEIYANIAAYRHWVSALAIVAVLAWVYSTFIRKRPVPLVEGKRKDLAPAPADVPSEPPVSVKGPSNKQAPDRQPIT